MGFKAFFEDIATKERRKRLENNQVALQQQLINAGFTPGEINEALATYVTTGELRMPTERKTGKLRMKGLPEGMFGPSQTEDETTPIELPRSKIIGIDSETGDARELYSGPTGGRVERVLYGKGKTPPKEEKRVGQTIYIQAKDGKEIRREPNGLSYDKYIRVGTADGGGGRSPAETPQEKLARAAITRYYDALKAGFTQDDMPEELLNSATSAADFLGLSLESVPSTRAPEEPGFLGRMMGKKPEETPPPVTVPRFKKGVEQPNVLTKPQQNKPLSKDLAKQFLQKAGGDKEKARKLAREAGYRF
ncbi:MAG: hypothetical protein EKK55_17460 [Rhodocyclaceae bacterium]|nr:MAG: hypothetical protein EKK55_17460 [Rhodocyclaceae bacterium]